MIESWTSTSYLSNPIGSYVTTPSSLISVDIIIVGHTNFLVKVELTWVQDFGISPKSSWRLPTNTLNISYK